MPRKKSGNPSRKLRLSPGGSGAAEPLNHGLSGATYDSPIQSPELEGAEDREGHANRCRRKPVSEVDQDFRPCSVRHTPPVHRSQSPVPVTS